MKRMNKLIFSILFCFVSSNLYGEVFSNVEPLDSFYHENFYNVIRKQADKVKDEYFIKSFKQYKQAIPLKDIKIYKSDKSDSGISLSYKDLQSSTALSVIILVQEDFGNKVLAEVFFIDTSKLISEIYSISGYINSDTISYSSGLGSPQWLYGTAGLIYADSSNYSTVDILTGKEGERIASLIFIPETGSKILNDINVVKYPNLSVINSTGKKNMLITDRKILNYFNKYNLEPSETFFKYKGGGYTAKVFIYAEKFGTSEKDGNVKIEITSVPVMFTIDMDKGFSRSYAYQKSPYKSLALKEDRESIKIYDKPMGTEIAEISRTYYKSRDILYMPWENINKDGVLWYAVILPKISKTGYVDSRTVDIRSNERYGR